MLTPSGRLMFETDAWRRSPSHLQVPTPPPPFALGCREKGVFALVGAHRCFHAALKEYQTSSRHGCGSFVGNTVQTPSDASAVEQLPPFFTSGCPPPLSCSSEP